MALSTATELLRLASPPFPPPSTHRTRLGARSSFRCSARGRGDEPNRVRDALPLLKMALSTATELLRLASPNKGKYKDKDGEDEEGVVGCVDDVVSILQSDYQRAYFLTGNFTSDIYSEDCLFEDPTIRFRGKNQYSRNLELLVPFYNCPSLALEKIEKGVNNGREFVLATWKLRTYLRLPWRPLISVDGTTLYDLNSKFKIVRHAESWNVSALEAVGQIFTPSRKDE